MPINYCVNAAIGILEVKATGEISVADRATLVQRVIQDVSMPEVVPILIDVSAISAAPKMTDITKMAHLAECLSIRFQSRLAYFVNIAFATEYTLAAFSVRREGAEVRAFTNRATAEAWLLTNTAKRGPSDH